jgi:hypothetical protein
MPESLTCRNWIDKHTNLMTATPPRSDRYASATQPINSRTAPAQGKQTASRASATPTVLPPGFRDRMVRLAAQKRLGPGLVQALARGAGPSPLSAGVVLMALGGTAAGVVAILLGLRGALPEFAVATVVSLGLFAGAWVRRSRERNPIGRARTGKLPLDEASLQALDTVCENVAPALQADAVAALRGIKASLVRMLPMLNAAEVDGHFTRDDLSYTVELVRRYLPDTLEAYLRVPAAQRGQATDGQSSDKAPDKSSGQSSADALLLAQLRLLQTELNQRETRLGQLRTGALEQQGRFLEAKSQQR